MSVHWSEYKFEPIQLLDSWNAPSSSGIYAITFITSPEKHCVLYFGETDDFSTRGIDSSHHKYKCWESNANHKDLYISIHLDSSKESRAATEKKLIKNNHPPCNEQLT